MVGEYGPELMRFRGGEQVVPHHALRSSNEMTADLLQRVTRDGEALLTTAA